LPWNEIPLKIKTKLLVNWRLSPLFLWHSFIHVQQKSVIFYSYLYSLYGIVSLLMAFSVTHCYYNSFPSLSHFSKTSIKKHVRCSFPLIRAAQAGEPKPETKSDASSSSSSTTTAKSSPSPPKTLPKKPVYSCESTKSLFIYLSVWFHHSLLLINSWTVKKGQIVRVDKEKYLSSINVRRRRLLIFSFNYSNFNCDEYYY
jgi:hypothetical protein